MWDIWWIVQQNSFLSDLNVKYTAKFYINLWTFASHHNISIQFNDFSLVNEKSITSSWKLQMPFVKNSNRQTANWFWQLMVSLLWWKSQHIMGKDEPEKLWWPIPYILIWHLVIDIPGMNMFYWYGLHIFVTEEPIFYILDIHWVRKRNKMFVFISSDKICSKRPGLHQTTVQ